MTVATSVQEEVVLSFFNTETEARLVSDGDPKMLFVVDKTSRKRNVFRAERRDGSETLAVKAKRERNNSLFCFVTFVFVLNRCCSFAMLARRCCICARFGL
jgi:hypothetical protein